MSLEQMLDEIAEESTREASRPGAWHSPSADAAFFWFEGVPYHADYINPMLTMFCADDDNRIVGVEVKGVSLLPDWDELECQLEQDGRRACVRVLVLTLRELTLKPGHEVPWDAVEAALHAATRLGEATAK